MIQERNKRYVVVFDIDDALCQVNESAEQLELTKKYDPECPIIRYIHTGDRFKGEYIHIFIPYLNILFEYLIEQGVRIAFFSSALKERNISVIPELLTSFWGETQYQTLKSKGQFDIFSREDLRLGLSVGREGNCVKDLSIVIQKNESLLDAVLIENDPSYTAYDQEPSTYVIDLFSSYLDERRKEEARGNHFSKNSAYYMIGLFKTYFEHDLYKKSPFRAGLDQILPKDRKEYYSFFRENPFAHRMMRIGFKEVQKKVPDVILYKSLELAETPLATTDPSEVTISKETKYESFIRNLIIGNIPLSMHYLAEYLFEMFVSVHIADTKQLAECYKGAILNLIESLTGRDDITIEHGTKTYDLFVTSTKKFENSHRPITLLLSFIYVLNENELEDTAKIALQDIKPQVDMKKSSERYISIVGVGVAFSGKSLLAAYTSYKEHSKVRLTDIYKTR